MSDRIYLGTLLGDDGHYYKGVFSPVGLARIKEFVYSYGGNILCAVQDVDYLYIGGSVTNKIVKLDKTDFSVVAESPVQSDSIKAMVADDSYVYIIKSDTVVKFNKGDLSLVSQSSARSYTPVALGIYGEYVYVGGSTTLEKLDKVDFSLSASANSTSYIESLVVDGTHVYLGLISYSDTHYIALEKYTIHTLTKEPGQFSVDGHIYTLEQDDNHLWLGVDGNIKAIVLLDKNLNELNRKGYSGGYRVRVLNVSGEHVYFTANGQIFKAEKDLTIKAIVAPAISGIVPQKMLSDDRFVYSFSEVIHCYVEDIYKLTGYRRVE